MFTSDASDIEPEQQRYLASHSLTSYQLSYKEI